MRVLVCSKRDLTSVVILNDLLERLAAIPGCTVALMLAERTRKIETTVPELSYMKALERDLPFGVLFPLADQSPDSRIGETAVLDRLAERYNLPVDDLDRRPVAGSLCTLNQLVERHGVPCRVVLSADDPEFVAATAAFAPDLILSARFSFVLAPALLALAKHGAINVHPGRLPVYAGLYPHFYSMLAGEPALGCTVHIVDTGIDTGPVLAAGEIPIVASRSAFANNLDSHLLGNRLAAGIVAALAEGGRLAGVAQDGSRRRLHTYPTREEFGAFRMKGLTLVDMGEYLDLFRRFGLFGGISPPRRGARLQDSLESAKLGSAPQG